MVIRLHTYDYIHADVFSDQYRSSTYLSEQILSHEHDPRRTFSHWSDGSADVPDCAVVLVLMARPRRACRRARTCDSPRECGMCL